MKVISRDKLIEVIAVLQGCQPATLVTETDARLKKTGNSFGQVNKLSRVNCMIGFIYENAVNRQQVREGAEHGAFEAQAHAWAEHIEGCNWLVKNPKTDELYLVVKVQKSLEHPTYIKAISREPLAYEDVKPFLPAKRSNADAQGVEREVIYRQYKLSSIKELHIGGEQYAVVATPQVVTAQPALVA